MKKLEIRFRRYHDIFNVALQKRFYDSYKIDLLEEDNIILSSILNTKSGTIYSDELISFQLIDKSSFLSSKHHSELHLNGEHICSYYIANPMRNLLSFHWQKHEIRFSDGRFISFSFPPSGFNFKEHKVSYRLTERGDFSGEINAARKYLYFKSGNDFDYSGEICFKEHYSMIELMLFLQFVLIDCLYLEKMSSN